MLFALNVKHEVARGKITPLVAGLGLALALFASGEIFKEISGGILNPAVGLGMICWQNLTYTY